MSLNLNLWPERRYPNSRLTSLGPTEYEKKKQKQKQKTKKKTTQQQKQKTTTTFFAFGKLHLKSPIGHMSRGLCATEIYLYRPMSIQVMSNLKKIVYVERLL